MPHSEAGGGSSQFLSFLQQITEIGRRRFYDQFSANDTTTRTSVDAGIKEQRFRRSSRRSERRSARRHRPVLWPPVMRPVVRWVVFRATPGSAHGGTSRAASRNRSSGNPAGFRVQADRLDHEIELVGAVDLARCTIGHAGLDELGFGEVIEPVNPLRVAVAHEEHGVRRVFRPRDQKEMVGAEVEHVLGGERREPKLPPPRQRRCGVSRWTPPPGYHHSAARHRSRRYDFSAGGLGSLGLRRLSPPSRKTSEFSTKRSAIAVAIVVLNRMLPQSENAVFVVIIVERFWLCRVEMT